jgi:flagellar M-ring protein FliF
LFTESRETSDTEYSHAKTTDTTTIVGGDILRLTVAAMVDLTPPKDDPNSPIAALDKTQIERVIKQAVGLDTTRGDEIEVLYTSLAPADISGPSLVETIDKWQFYTEIVRHASLGLAALVALALGLLLLKKVRPLTSDTKAETGLDAERTRLMAELATQARENPDIVSRIVEAWMEVPDPQVSVPMNPSGAARRKAA